MRPLPIDAGCPDTNTRCARSPARASRRAKKRTIVPSLTMDAGFIAIDGGFAASTYGVQVPGQGVPAAGEGSLDPCAGGKANPDPRLRRTVGALVEGLVVRSMSRRWIQVRTTSEKFSPRSVSACDAEAKHVVGQVGQRAVPAGAQARRQRQHAQVAGAGAQHRGAQRPGQGSLPHHAANGRSEVAKRAAASRRSDGPRPAAGSGKSTASVPHRVRSRPPPTRAHTPARLAPASRPSQPPRRRNSSQGPQPLQGGLRHGSKLSSILLGGRRRNGVHEEIAGVGPIDLGNVEGRLRRPLREPGIAGQCSSLGQRTSRPQQIFPLYRAADCAAPGAPQLAPAIKTLPGGVAEWQDQLNPQGYGVDVGRQLALFHAGARAPGGGLETLHRGLNFSGQDQWVDIPFLATDRGLMSWPRPLRPLR